MYNDLASSAAVAGVPQLIGPALVVNAVIDNPAVAGGASAFGTLYRVEADVPTTPPPPGEYAIVLKDALGGELLSVPFAVSFESEYSAPGAQAHSHGPFDLPHVHGAADPPVGDPAPTPLAGVALTIPWVDGTTQIVLEKSGVALDTRAVSANPPAVLITDPGAPEVWPAGSTQTISWSASDPDGGALTFALFYAADGVSWQLLADGISGTSYAVAADALAGGASARFRVVASDGVNIGDDESAPVSVPDKLPMPIIAGPADASDLAVGDLLVLEGFAADLEDGTLPDAALSWASDRQGALGTGPTVPVSGLQPGEHTITLTAVDSAGQSASATAKIYVGARVFLPVTGR
jgi:hypothetical protein